MGWTRWGGKLNLEVCCMSGRTVRGGGGLDPVRSLPTGNIFLFGRIDSVYFVPSGQLCGRDWAGNMPAMSPWDGGPFGRKRRVQGLRPWGIYAGCRCHGMF
mmetsp:Transcript_3280/g.9357  ORF Transcript_3280/g.9357 Transcript_3280/m.9357 type:complete len:101 (+) Transcript_3280:1347-1649(+)